MQSRSHVIVLTTKDADTGRIKMKVDISTTGEGADSDG